jgi:hypothetical protein
MTTTDRYLLSKEYYNKDEDISIRYQTNSRYRNFKQVLYTAGDEEQFTTHISYENGTTKIIDCEKNNIWKDVKVIKHFLKNTSVSSKVIMKNFRYHFHTLKKGIFVKIINNKVKVFLPFSKHNFDNKWDNRLEMTNREILNLYKNCHERSGRGQFNIEIFLNGLLIII